MKQALLNNTKRRLPALTALRQAVRDKRPEFRDQRRFPLWLSAFLVVGVVSAFIDRYRQLTEAAFTTLDGRLTDHEWLAGDSYSIADIATFGWTHIAGVGGIDFSHHKHLTRWHRHVAARPAVQRGVTLPEVATAP